MVLVLLQTALSLFLSRCLSLYLSLSLCASAVALPLQFGPGARLFSDHVKQGGEEDGEKVEEEEGTQETLNLLALREYCRDQLGNFSHAFFLK